MKGQNETIIQNNMDTVETKYNVFIDIVKRNDVAELKEYFKKNDINLNKFYKIIKSNKKEIMKLIKSNSSPEVYHYFMKFVGENRKNIIEIIKENDTKKLNMYLLENNISLKDYNTRDFDILLSSIDIVNVSVDMIKFIMDECQYQSLNYSVNNRRINVLKRTPLFCAITNNNFKVADLLIQYKADINYSNGDILYYLFYLDMLEQKNLNYLLKNGIKQELIIDFISFLIQNSPYTLQPIAEYLKTIFNHYLFSNEFILKFLLIYKNKEPFSNRQIQEKIENITNILIKDQFYKEAVYYQFNEAINLLLRNDPRNKTELKNKIEEFKKLGSYTDDEEDDEDDNEDNQQIEDIIEINQH